MSDVLTSAELERVSGLPFSTIDLWCRNGTFRPLVLGRGAAGHYRRFSAMHALAAYVARRWREAGFGPPLVALAARHVPAWTEQELLADFAAGRTVLLPARRGDGLALAAAPGLGWDLVDLQAAYREVKRAIAALPRKASSCDRRATVLSGTGE
jgi:hypothetical protein